MKGSVNRYKDNGDGGHSHEHWNNKDDYNDGDDPDQSRLESNDSENPDTGEVQESTGCYLTTACMNYFGVNFDDNCYQLFVLRWFRDNYVKEEDVKLYYELAPKIVKAIDKLPNKQIAYEYIYDYIVDACVNALENGNYNFAYDRYKNSVLSLSKNFK